MFGAIDLGHSPCQGRKGVPEGGEKSSDWPKNPDRTKKPGGGR